MVPLSSRYREIVRTLGKELFVKEELFGDEFGDAEKVLRLTNFYSSGTNGIVDVKKFVIALPNHDLAEQTALIQQAKYRAGCDQKNTSVLLILYPN